MKVEINTLSEGDLFIHREVLYEIFYKQEHSSLCRYINKHYGKECMFDKYLYCWFSNFTKVEV